MTPCNPKSAYTWKTETEESEPECSSLRKTGLAIDGFEDGKGYKLRNVGHLQQLEKARKSIIS